MLFQFLRKFWEMLSGHRRQAVGTRPCSVGAALEVATCEENLPLLTAVLAVDQVHQDGVLPVITVDRRPLKNRHGQFVHRLSGPALGIVVNPVTDHPGLTMLHEIGHFLDHSALGVQGAWASESDTMLDDWREAVRSSEAVQRLGQVLKNSAGRVQETLPGGTVVEYAINLAYVRYLLRPNEIWARSYAQFIAVQSGDADLLAQLDRRRTHPARGYFYGEHWNDADFEPIRAPIEAIFRQKGWMI